MLSDLLLIIFRSQFSALLFGCSRITKWSKYLPLVAFCKKKKRKQVSDTGLSVDSSRSIGTLMLIPPLLLTERKLSTEPRRDQLSLWLHGYEHMHLTRYSFGKNTSESDCLNRQINNRLK